MSIIDKYIEKRLEPIKRETQKEIKKLVKEKKELKESNEKLIDQTTESQWTPITLNGTQIQDKSSTLLEEYMSWVYANISAISEAVAQVKIQLYRLKNNVVEEVKEHPVLELIHRPNPYMTKSEFIELLTCYRLLTGESPIRLKGGLNPTELWPIDPLTISPIVAKTADSFELITGYELTDYSKGQIEVKKLKPNEIVFIKNINPRNKWRGYGVVEAAQGSIDTMHYSEKYNLNFFKNSAVPFTVLYTDQKLTEQIMSRLKDSWNTNYKGVNNAFKTAVLEAGLKVEKLQTSSKDMDFIEQQKFLRDKLMAMFKTTKIALGITEDVNRAAADASEYIFTKNCVKPKMAQFVEALNEFLLPLFDKTGTLFLDFEDPVPRDRTALINEYSAGYNKWLTPNEIRALEGYPEVEGGDEIWQSMVLTPMSEAIKNPPVVGNGPNNPSETNQPQPNQPEEPQEIEPVPLEPNKYFLRVMKATKKKELRDFSEQVANLRNRNIRMKALKEEFAKEIGKLLKSKVKTKTVPKYEPKYKDMRTKEDTDKYIKTLLDNSDKFEKKFNDVMKWKFYQPQMEFILNRLDKGTKFIYPQAKSILKQVGDEFMFDQNEQVNTAIDIITPEIEAILLAQGYEAMLTVSGMTYSLLDEARKYLAQTPKKLAKSITKTAYTRVRNSLAEGIKEGESINELKDRVLREYESLEVYQAENIARTEVTRATNFAAVDAFRQSGVIEGKEWMVVHDDRLCGYCAAMESLYKENLIKRLDENFFNKGDKIEEIDIETGEKTGKSMVIDYDDVNGPPLHCQCRCQLKAVEKIVEKQTKEVEKTEKTEEDLLKEIEEELIKVKNG
jgi:HK97 family phage portal protein